MKTLEKINEILDQCTGRHCQIDNNTSITVDLGVSSLEFFEFIILLEKEFHVKFDDSKISQFRTISDVINFIDKNNASEKIKTTNVRATAMEIAKAICMLGLPFIHIIEQFGLTYDSVDFQGINPMLLLILTVIGPGLFLICMGYDIKSEKLPGRLLKDGIQLILVGFILNIIRFFIPYFIVLSSRSSLSPTPLLETLIQTDIYYVAGLFYLLLSLLRKLKLSDLTILSISILMIAVNTIITSSNVSFTNELITYTLGNIFYIDETSIFPLLGWSIFPVIGILLSHSPLENLNNKKLFEILGCLIATLISIFASLYYFNLDIFSISVNATNNYITEICNVLIQIILSVILLCFLQIVLNLSKNNPIEKFFKKISYYLIPFYFIHWTIIGWVSIPVIALYPHTQSMPLWLLGILIVVITGVSLFLSVKAGMKLMRTLIKITTWKPFHFTRKPDKEVILNRKTIAELVENNGIYNSPAYIEYIDNKTRILKRKELNNKAVQIAEYLNSLGFKKNHIALFCNKSIDWSLVFYGITYTKNTVVLFNPELPENTTLEQLNFSDCTAIIYPDELKDKISLLLNQYQLSKISLSFTELISNAQKTKVKKKTFDIPTESDIAAILFSSGTTGKPKCVQLSHKNLISNLLSIQTMVLEHNYGRVHNTLIVLPVFHAFSLTISVLYPLFCGGYAAFNKDNSHLISDIQKSKPDYLALVPQLTKMLVVISKDYQQISLSKSLGGNLKHIICGGASLTKEIYDLYKDTDITLCNGYGITECSPVISYNMNDTNTVDFRLYPLPGVNIKISEIGEIMVKGDNVTPGYYNYPEANQEAFDNGWFKTGDLGEIDSNGTLKIIGRIKNIIILSNGENVSAELIENAFSSCPNILGMKVTENLNHLVLEIYPDWSVENVEKIITESANQINEKLPSIWRISKFVFKKEDFKRTSTGKIIH